MLYFSQDAENKRCIGVTVIQQNGCEQGSLSLQLCETRELFTYLQYGESHTCCTEPLRRLHGIMYAKSLAQCLHMVSSYRYIQFKLCLEYDHQNICVDVLFLTVAGRSTCKYIKWCYRCWNVLPVPQTTFMKSHYQRVFSLD